MELLDIIIIGAGVYTLLGVFLKFDFLEPGPHSAHTTNYR